jgi:phage head maturation protease
MFAMVDEKIIRNVSVGYSIDEVRVVEPTKKDEVEKRIATRWTPFEISFVTIPADAGAQVRASDETFPIAVVRDHAAVAAAARMRMRQLTII